LFHVVDEAIEAYTNDAFVELTFFAYTVDEVFEVIFENTFKPFVIVIRYPIAVYVKIQCILNDSDGSELS